jgi:hypothetical protein
LPSYFASTSPDWTESIPWVVSARTAGATFTSSGITFDIAISGIPFIMACSDKTPYQRQSADYRKQQFDNSKEAGEQSLDQNLWTRSQNNWNLGAGINYYEPGADDGTEFRYASSVGIDVWTLGQISLLHSMTKPASSAGYVGVTGCTIAGGDAFVVNNAGTLSRSDGTTLTAYTGFTSLVGKPVVAGTTIVGGANAQLYKGLTSGTTIASVAITGATGNLTPYYAKSRLIVTNANSLYELPLALAGGALPTALYTHPDANWVWTDISETTDAILASGYSNGYGAIYRFSLQQNGSATVPSLSAGFQICEFPPGEVPYAIKAYLGKYIAIGTNKGLRIGVITGQTSVSPTVIQYGPLTVTTTQPVISLAARDSYVFAGVNSAIDGSSGAVRVDLQQEVIQNSLRFPYAYDVNSHVSGAVDSIAFLGNSGRVVMGVEAQGVYQQSATAYETTGYLTSGKVRYATSELKAFRTARIRASFTDLLSGVTLSTIAPNGAESSIVRVTSASNADDFIAITRPVGQFEYLSFKMTLDGDATGSAVVESLLIKAIPAPVRSRVIQYPLSCFDHEADVNGAKFGTKGNAFTRLLALEALESAQAIVTLQDFTTGESFDAQIEKVAITRTSNRAKGDGNFGGMLVLQVRKFY